MRYYENSEDVGVNAVIGMDSKNNLESMAKLIGDNSFVDPNETLARAAGIRGIPHWLVVDEIGTIIAEHKGGLKGPPQALAPLFKLPLQ